MTGYTVAPIHMNVPILHGSPVTITPRPIDYIIFVEFTSLSLHGFPYFCIFSEKRGTARCFPISLDAGWARPDREVDLSERDTNPVSARPKYIKTIFFF